MRARLFSMYRKSTGSAVGPHAFTAIQDSSFESTAQVNQVESRCVNHPSGVGELKPESPGKDRTASHYIGRILIQTAETISGTSIVRGESRKGTE